jgi:hypothetical protein
MSTEDDLRFCRETLGFDYVNQFYWESQGSETSSRVLKMIKNKRFSDPKLKKMLINFFRYKIMYQQQSVKTKEYCRNLQNES